MLQYSILSVYINNRFENNFMIVCNECDVKLDFMEYYLMNNTASVKYHQVVQSEVIL